jgi:hypothetical protein
MEMPIMGYLLTFQGGEPIFNLSSKDANSGHPCSHRGEYHPIKMEEGIARSIVYGMIRDSLHNLSYWNAYRSSSVATPCQ